MRLTAALCWYDESPKDLETCIRGIGNAADKVVAFDGAYKRYPNAKAASPVDQANTINRVCKQLGMKCEIFTPSEPWAGQVAKRSALIAATTVDSPDWIAIVDTDHVIKTERLWIRGTLNTLVSNFDIDVLAASYYTPPNDARPIKDSASTNWHTSLAGTRSFVPHIFRALPEMKVEKFHWWYSAQKNSERVWIWGEGDQVDGSRKLPWSYLDPAKYEVEHRCLVRDERHVLENRAFCNDRIKVIALTGQEDDIEGLFVPEYDYETLPY